MISSRGCCPFQIGMRDGNYDGKGDCVTFGLNDSHLLGRLPWGDRVTPCPRIDLGIIGFFSAPFSATKPAIRLTAGRWQQIIANLPKMSTQQQRVLDTVAEPGLIQEGDFGELLAVRYYEETPMNSKYLVVDYREFNTGDGFIVTAYLTRRPSTRRPVLWMR